jgi:hypothetical protein
MKTERDRQAGNCSTDATDGQETQDGPDRQSSIADICMLFAAALTDTSHKFWRIGKIVEALQASGEHGVIDEVAKQSRYEKRTVQYALAVFRALPDEGELVKLIDKGVEWTHFKVLASLKDDAERKQLVEKVLDGSLDPIDISGSVKEIKQRGQPVLKLGPAGPCTHMEKYTALMNRLDGELQAIEADYDRVLEAAADEGRTSEAQFTRFQDAAREAMAEMILMQQKLKAISDRFQSDMFEEELAATR